MRVTSGGSGRLVGAVAVLAAIAVSLLWAMPTSANPENADLFAGVDEAVGLPPSANDLGVVRARQVEVDLRLLGGQGDSGIEIAPANSVQFNLFDDRRYTANFESSETLADGAFVWNGIIPALDSGSITVAVRDGQMTASITANNKLYEVRPGSDDVHQLREIDPGTIEMVEADAIPLPANDPDALRPARYNAGAAPGTPVIDLLIVYTAAARQGAGGTDAMESLIDTNIAYTNTAFANSGIDAQVRKVHTHETNYAEGDPMQDLGRLRIDGDGYMDEVAGLRDQYGADLVHMYVEQSGDGGFCGIANILGVHGITVRNCADGGRTFAHELGHNFGAYHDWYVDAEDTAAHGHVDLDNQFLTIMSYYSRCAAAGVNCTSTNTFSNPNISFNGVPTGIPSGTDRNCATNDVNMLGCDSNNAAELNRTALAVSQRRPAADSPPSTPETTVAPTTTLITTTTSTTTVAPSTTEAPVTPEAPTTTVAPSTTEAPTTTVAPSTTEAPTTTEAPATTTTSTTAPPVTDGNGLTVRARGYTGDERLEIQVGGVSVGAINLTTTMADYVVTLPEDTMLSDVRVAYVNDANRRNYDRTVQVDYVIYKGVTYQSEDESTLASGVYDGGCRSGALTTETLHCNGYFAYGGAGGDDGDDDDVVQVGKLVIRASGYTGDERFDVVIDQLVVESVEVTTELADYEVSVPADAAIGDIQVVFTNDAVMADYDRNLQVDSVTLNGTVYQSESPTTYADGGYQDGACISGNLATEVLFCLGYFQYG